MEGGQSGYEGWLQDSLLATGRLGLEGGQSGYEGWLQDSISYRKHDIVCGPVVAPKEEEEQQQQ